MKTEESYSSGFFFFNKKVENYFKVIDTQFQPAKKFSAPSSNCLTSGIKIKLHRHMDGRTEG